MIHKFRIQICFHLLTVFSVNQGSFHLPSGVYVVQNRGSSSSKHQVVSATWLLRSCELWWLLLHHYRDVLWLSDLYPSHDGVHVRLQGQIYMLSHYSQAFYSG